MLLGLLEKNRKKIIEFERQDLLLKYIKYEMIEETLDENGAIEDLLIKESVRLFKNGKIYGLEKVLKDEKEDKKNSKSLILYTTHGRKI